MFLGGNVDHWIRRLACNDLGVVLKKINKQMSKNNNNTTTTTTTTTRTYQFQFGFQTIAFNI